MMKLAMNAAPVIAHQASAACTGVPPPRVRPCQAPVSTSPRRASMISTIIAAMTPPAMAATSRAGRRAALGTDIATELGTDIAPWTTLVLANPYGRARGWQQGTVPHARALGITPDLAGVPAPASGHRRDGERDVPGDGS